MWKIKHQMLTKSTSPQTSYFLLLERRKGAKNEGLHRTPKNHKGHLPQPQVTPTFKSASTQSELAGCGIHTKQEAETFLFANSNHHNNSFIFLHCLARRAQSFLSPLTVSSWSPPFAESFHWGGKGR